ncbi:MAG: hypothetical protein R6V62_03510 [Candidatus Fermentibacteraceae bacterium]
MKLRGRQIGRLLAALPELFPVLPFIVIVVTVMARGVPDHPSSGDASLLELSTRWLFSHRILLGPYSRFVFFHPGPLYFFLRFPLYALFQWSSSSFLLTTAILGGLSVFGVRAVIRRCSPPGGALIFSAVMGAFLVVTGPALWFSEWNPLVIALPLLFFFTCTAAIGAGCTGFTLPAVIAGSFAAQTHMGSIPAIVLTAAAALVLRRFTGITCRRRSEAAATRVKWLFPAAVLLLLWAPPLYEEIASAPQGNITRIVVFMTETLPEHGFSLVYHDWSLAVTGFELDLLRAPLHGLGALDAAVVALPIIRAVLLALAFLAMRKREGGRFAASFSLLCLLLHGASLYSGTQIRGERLVYLFEWMRVLAPLSIGALLLSLFQYRQWGVTIRRSAAVFASALALYTSVLSATDAGGFLTPPSEQSGGNDMAVRELSGQLLNWLSSQPEAYNSLVLRTPGLWPVLTGLANSLDKHGYMVGMDGIYAIRVPPAPEGVPVRVVLFGRSTDPSTGIPGTIASYEGMVVVIPPE